jgi:polyferredoxin
MNLLETASVALTSPATLISPAEWDIVSLFTNGQGLMEKIGAALLGLLGIIAVLCAVVFAFNKLVSEQSRRSWVMIIALFLLGGLLIGGSISLFTSIAEGAKTTIDQLGGGLIILGIGR